MNDLIEIALIIDRSYNMTELHDYVIIELNKMIRKLKQSAGHLIVSIVFYDTKIDVVYDRVKISDVKPITSNEYYSNRNASSRISTAVLTTAMRISKAYESLEQHEKPNKTMFFIITEGYVKTISGCTSHDMTRFIKPKIDDEKWDIYFFAAVYSGTKYDQFSISQQFGIKLSSAMTYERSCMGIYTLFDNIYYVLDYLRIYNEVLFNKF